MGSSLIKWSKIVGRIKTVQKFVIHIIIYKSKMLQVS